MLYSIAGVFNEYTTHTTSTNGGDIGAGLEYQPPTAGLGMSTHRFYAITAAIP